MRYSVADIIPTLCECTPFIIERKGDWLKAFSSDILFDKFCLWCEEVSAVWCVSWSWSRSQWPAQVQCSALGSRREHSLHDWDRGYDHWWSWQHSVVTEPGLVVRREVTPSHCHQHHQVIRSRSPSLIPSEGLHWRFNNIFILSKTINGFVHVIHVCSSVHHLINVNI